METVAAVETCQWGYSIPVSDTNAVTGGVTDMSAPVQIIQS